MAVRALSAKEVEHLRHPGGRGNAMFAVGGTIGLYLQITPRGARSWILRFTVGAKRRDMGLGGFPDISLARARERAREARDQAWRGVDPIEHRKAAHAALAAARAQALTFDEAFRRYADAKLQELKTSTDRTRWRSSIERYALPALGEMEVGSLTTPDVLRALEPIWVEKTDTARRVRARIEAILSWASSAGHRTGENPARWKGNLDHLLPRPSSIRVERPRPAVALDEAAAWFAALMKRDDTAAKALAFAALCASRSAEVRGATWDEIDAVARVWIIPAGRMKMEREHRVPLCGAALCIIEAQPRRNDTLLIFSAPRGGEMKDEALGQVMRDMQAVAEGAAEAAGEDPSRAGWRDPRSGRPAVPHGLRSTFRDWVAERTDYPRETAEIALAHQVGSEVERAYRRSDMVEKRRLLMEAWSKFLGAHV